jgi:NIMA (never in mitosis gene a)-related kinase
MSCDDFDFLQRLGSGSFGTVFRVRRRIDDLIYVVKVVRIAELTIKEKGEAINEVRLLAQIDNPFIVRYFDSFIDQEALHIVMEFCNRGDLSILLRRAKEKCVQSLKEDLTWNICLQILLGLYCLHHQKILHRDLKTANVFLQKDPSQRFFAVKIGDLGVAKLLETSTAFAQTIVGTPYYLSPELCADQPYRDRSDCWALGIILYECCTLSRPFTAGNQCALIMKIIQAAVEPPPETHASGELSSLVLWLLQKDWRQRPSVKEVLCDEFVRCKLAEHGLPLPDDLVDEPVTALLSFQEEQGQEQGELS